MASKQSITSSTIPITKSKQENKSFGQQLLTDFALGLTCKEEFGSLGSMKHAAATRCGVAFLPYERRHLLEV